MFQQTILPHNLRQRSLVPSSTPQLEESMKTRGRNKLRLAIPYTKRDILILYAVFVVRYMTTPQIWKLFFSHASMLVCNQRLKKLVDYGLLRVIEQAIKRGEGRKPYIYALTSLGGELLTYERGVD